MRTRLPPDERRRHLLRVAGEILTEHGVDGLQFTELASRAGVSRPVVYKFFATRPALITAVLEDLEADLHARFVAVLRGGMPSHLEGIARVLIDAVCDTIEHKGAGAWQLLDSKGPDPDVARVGRAVQQRLLRPWRPRIAAITGASPREVRTVADMTVASGRAVLELWYRGRLSRSDAARDASRGIAALLRAFTVATG